MINWSEEDLKSYLERNNKTSPKIKPKKSKYHNKKVKIDGHVFDSIKESEYYCELKLRLKAKDILGFCIQPIFILSPSISYRPDFIVWNIDKSVDIIDIKGFKTDAYKMKKKLFEEKFKLKIKEIY
jgi:hypothetical protein